MLSFVTSQATALSQAKQTSDRQRTRKRAEDARRSLVSRVFEALAESRMRQAEIVLAHYRRLLCNHLEKVSCKVLTSSTPSRVPDAPPRFLVGRSSQGEWLVR
jgi:hypothetical protein